MRHSLASGEMFLIFYQLPSPVSGASAGEGPGVRSIEPGQEGPGVRSIAIRQKGRRLEGKSKGQRVKDKGLRRVPIPTSSNPHIKIKGMR